MGKLFTILLIFVSSLSFGQCVGNQTVSVIPAGPYQAGDVVVVTYTLWNFNQVNINWIIAFELDLGSGWCGVQPLQSPSMGAGGSWLWDVQNTYPSGLNFGPGWRFQNTGNANWGTSSTGPFTMRVQLTVCQTCTADDLSVGINVYGDCQTGGWNNGNCCSDPTYQIYNGVVQIVPPITQPINHY
tara:strand:- start:21398 stop:21952 length:555 start_codon:yes stop_codon:yes gene_type:complete